MYKKKLIRKSIKRNAKKYLVVIFLYISWNYMALTDFYYSSFTEKRIRHRLFSVADFKHLTDSSKFNGECFYYTLRK